MELNEDVLGVVVEFVGMVDVRAVRATCKQLRDVAARVAWRDRSVRVLGSRLHLWRACFPRAQAVAIWSAEDEDLQWVEGVLDVDLYGFSSITDEGLRHLGHVTKLDLSRCKQITDEGLRHLGHVTALDLSCCYQITDKGLRHLGHVTTLDLSFCDKFTDEGLRPPRARDGARPRELQSDHGRGAGAPWEREAAGRPLLPQGHRGGARTAAIAGGHADCRLATLRHLYCVSIPPLPAPLVSPPWRSPPQPAAAAAAATVRV